MAALVSATLLGLGGCEQKETTQSDPPKESEVKTVKTPPTEDKGKVVTTPKEPGVAKVEAGPNSAPDPDPEPKVAETPRVEPLPKPEPKLEAHPGPPKKPWTVAQAGFAAKLPPHTDFYFDARELDGIWKWLDDSGALEQGTKYLGDAIDGSEAPKEIQKLLNDGIRLAPDLLGEEAFLAGRGMSWSWETAMGMNVWMYNSMGSMVASGLASGNMDFFLGAEDMGEEMSKSLAKWFESQVEKADGFPKVATYLGGRVSDDKKRAEMLKWMREVFSLAAKETEAIKAAEFEKSGAQWTGFEIRLAALEGFDTEPAPDGIDTQMWNEMLRQIGEWSLVVACAEVDNYIVIAAGNGQESIELAENVDDSLAKVESFKFFEQYESSEIVSTFWTSKEMIASGQTGMSYLPFFEGAVDGLKGSQLKRGEGIVKALSEFNEHWKARRSGEAHEHIGTILVGDEVRIETRGGWVGAGVDLKTPLKFARAFSALEKTPFVRAHWKTKTEHIAHGHKQVDAGMRFLKLVGEEVMDAFSENVDGDDDDANKFKRWKRDLSKGLEDIWKGYRDQFSKAFGEESAFVMDLDGAMIPAVGVDEELVENGKIPRAAFVRPVVKREALSESWDVWQGALTNLFGIVAESLDQPIPFPDTMTAEKDDLRTYFFPFPFASDDFLPSVSVSDDLFILGSSKTLSEDLYEAALKSKGGEEEAGLWIDVNADALWDFSEIWLDVYEKKKAAADEIEEDELQRKDAEPGPDGLPENGDEGDAREDPDELKIEGFDLKEGKVEIDPEMLNRIAELRAKGTPAALEEAEQLQKKLLGNVVAGEIGEFVPIPDGQKTRPAPGPELPPVEPRIELPDALENPLLKELNKEGDVPDGRRPGEGGEEVVPLELNPLELVPPELPPGGPELEKPGPLGRAPNKKKPEVELELEFPQNDQGAPADPDPGLEIEELGFSGPFGGLFDAPEPDLLRGWLDKLRVFRGIRYHRWLEDGVPRSTVRVKLGR